MPNHHSEEVSQAHRAVLAALGKAREWDIVNAKGGQVVATRPDPMREIRFLMKAEARACPCG